MSSAIATFAIPCHNAGSHLRTQLESLLAQTRQDFVLLLVDDASTDGSADLARDVAGDRITIYQNEERLGLAGNWNRCVELIQTPYFCLAHMDDRFAPRYLERMVAALDADPTIGMVHCKARAIDVDGNPFPAAAERYKERFWARLQEGESIDQVYRLLFHGNFINCPTILFRTDAWREVGPYPEDLSFALDWWFAFQMLLKGHRVVGVPESLLDYRRHEGSATKAHIGSLNRYAEERQVIAWAKDEGVQRGWIDPDFISPALRNNLLYDAFQDLQNGDKRAADEKVRYARGLPELARDPVLRAFDALRRLGPVGRLTLNAGLKLVLWKGRRERSANAGGRSSA